MRTTVGLRFYMTAYTKTAISIADQINNLKNDGLTFMDENYAEDYMLSVGYFRLKSYFHSFYYPNSSMFVPNTMFESVVELYRFDCELRNILFAAIQDVEVAIRTRIVHFFSLRYNPFWYAERQLFKDRNHFFSTLAQITAEISRTKEDFIIDHFNTYDEPNLPPAWKALEAVTIGSLSSLFRNCKDPAAKKDVAHSLSIPNYKFLESWLECLRVLRNACAHHSRIWNKRIQSPIVPNTLPSSWISIRPSRPEKIYSHLCYIAYIQQSLPIGKTLKVQLKTLLNQYPKISVHSMGFPPQWDTEPLWR